MTLITPDNGAQACGDIGAGRMPEPLALRDIICQHFQPRSQLLAGKSVLITAGPTREAIDPVRYLSNHSSGKMGFALAAAAQQLGATVTLVTGPVQLATPTDVTRIDVVSAEDMYQAVMNHIDQADVFIGCAAVADYRPELVATSKIKKSQDTMHLALIKNPDILASVASLPNPPFTIGFAAETNDVVQYAQRKLEQKRIRLIAANDVSDTNIGFNSDVNAMHLLWQDKQGQLQQLSLDRANKLQIATQLLQHAATLMNN